MPNYQITLRVVVETIIRAKNKDEAEEWAADHAEEILTSGNVDLSDTVDEAATRLTKDDPEYDTKDDDCVF